MANTVNRSATGRPAGRGGLGTGVSSVEELLPPGKLRGELVEKGEHAIGG